MAPRLMVSCGVVLRVLLGSVFWVLCGTSPVDIFFGGAGHECGPGGTRGRRTLVSLWDLPLASPPGRHPNSHVVRAARVWFSGFYASRAGRGPLGLQDVIDLSAGYIHVSASEP